VLTVIDVNSTLLLTESVLADRLALRKSQDLRHNLENSIESNDITLSDAMMKFELRLVENLADSEKFIHH
jgi:hypothetical protein